VSVDLQTRYKQLKPRSFTSYSLRDVNACPTADQSAKSGRRKKCERSEILTNTPVRSYTEKNLKQEVLGSTNSPTFPI
jgi:hypothetical protein